jgi:hypothetical protein
MKAKIVLIVLFLLIKIIITEKCQEEDFGSTYSECKDNKMLIIHYKNKECGICSSILTKINRWRSQNIRQNNSM